MNWSIKRFEELTIEELYEILKLRSEVFIVEQECSYQDLDDKDKKSYHLFLKEDKKIIAYSRIIEKGISYDEVSIGRVVVDKDSRGRGLARELLLKAINFIATDLKENEIKISAQAYLVEFYKSVGFKEVSDIYLEDNIPHIKMVYKK